MKPRFSKGRDVLVRDDVVVKIQEPEASRRERLRTMAGREVGRETGLFVVPEVISFDDSRGEIVFERLLLTGSQQALSDRLGCLEFLGRTATALAAIHRCMASTELPRVLPGPAPLPSRERVPLHGDFGLRNVFFLTGSDGLVIIDWANADWIGLDGGVGAPEIDLAVFLVSLFHRRVFDRSRVVGRQRMARHFLATYASASSHGVDMAILSTTLARIIPRFNQRNQRRKGLRALGYRHSMVHLEFFLRRLDGKTLASQPDYSG